MNTHIAFSGYKFLISGSLLEVARNLHTIDWTNDSPQPLIFETATGRQIDIDLRGSESDIVARFSEQPAVEPKKQGRGRPKLGVVGREVTLFPRHWQWLERQRGGASATLRRLVEEASRYLHQMRFAMHKTEQTALSQPLLAIYPVLKKQLGRFMPEMKVHSTNTLMGGRRTFIPTH